jgi:Zn ribbon nucleic-acid-binding protein
MNLYQQQAIEYFNSIAVAVCPQCHTAMRLFGIEADAIGSELLSFECSKCERIETRTDRCQ